MADELKPRAYTQLESRIVTPREKNYLQKALACGYPLRQLEAFADEIRGQSEEWLATHKIAAYYLGDGSFAPILSGVRDYTVTKATTATAFTSPPASSTVGDAVSFNVEVRNTSGGLVPIGAVLFTVVGSSPGAPINLVDGRATLTLSTPLAVGPHTIKAVFNGSANFDASPEVQVTHTVNPLATTTSFVSPPASSTAGDAVSFNVEVKAATGSAKPTGNVQFTVAGAGTRAGAPGGRQGHPHPAHPAGCRPARDQGRVCGRRQLRRQSGSANAPHGQPRGDRDGLVSFRDRRRRGHRRDVDGHSHHHCDHIVAEYSGGGNFRGSSSTEAKVTVTAAATTTALSASSAEWIAGTAVTFTATVATGASGAGTPTGTVTFKIDSSDASGPLPLQGKGTATFSPTTLLNTGPHTIVAEYSGGGNFLGGSSSEVRLKVNPAPTTTALRASATTSPAGTPVTFTVTVTPAGPGAGDLGGTVAFRIKGKDAGSVPVGSDGTAALTSKELTPGEHTISAEYTGGGNYLGSGSTEVTHTVKKLPTKTNLTASPTSSPSGEPVTFTAKVAGNGTPTGMVRFRVDGREMSGPRGLSNGSHAFTLTIPMAVGERSVVAAYLGDDLFEESASEPLAYQVTENK